MLDKDGYRPNVGIVLCNEDNRVFWARRAGQDGWQFPQGGMRKKESPEDALFRELEEETGLLPGHVTMVGRTRDWLYYQLPAHYKRSNGPDADFKGQKQLWFLLRLIGCDNDVRLDCAAKPEFDEWRWVDYWKPVEDVIAFKREVYQQALGELEPLLQKC